METVFREKFLPSPWARYGIAAALFLTALAARLLLLPVEARFTFTTFFPAVVLTLYLGGIGPGAWVAGLSALCGLYFFSPSQAARGFDAASLLAAAVLLVASAMVGWVVYRLEAASLRLHQALEQLRASERLLHTVVTDQTDMVFRFDHAGHFLFANPSGRLAFSLGEADLPGKTWHTLVPAAQHAEVQSRLRQFSPAQPVVKTETSFAGPAGETHWGEFVHHALFDARGRISEVQTVGRDITERRALQAELAEVSADLRDLYDHAPCGYFSVNAQGLFVRINATCLAWLGCTLEQVVGRLGPRDFYSPEGVADFDRNFPTFLTQGHIGPLEFDLLGRTGVARRVSVTATAVRDAHGAFLHSRSVMYDVTELARVRQELNLLNRQQASMLDNDLIGITKLKNRQALWQNRALERMFGYAPGELNGQPARVLYPDDASYEAIGTAAYPILAQGGTFRTQLRLVRKDGCPIWVDMSGAVISAQTGESMWMMLDITAMKEHQERVEGIAFHDGLTGLPNRILLLDRLQQAIPAAERLKSRFAVCFIDLDGFKAVNDNLGHGAGDRLLQVIGQRLLECVRGNDTVARLGGDEFVLLLTQLHDRDECDQVLARVVAAIEEPVDLGPEAVGHVAASVGVAFYPDDAGSGAELLKQADAAMYATKRARRGRESGTDLAARAPGHPAS